MIFRISRCLCAAAYLFAVFLFFSGLFTGCSKKDPLTEIKSIRNSYSVSINSLLKKDNDFIVELNIISNSRKTLSFLTVKFEELDNENKLVNYSRQALDVSDITPLSSSLKRIVIPVSSPEVVGLTCTIEADPTDNAVSSMKEFENITAN